MSGKNQRKYTSEENELPELTGKKDAVIKQTKTKEQGLLSEDGVSWVLNVAKGKLSALPSVIEYFRKMTPDPAPLKFFRTYPRYFFSPRGKRL